MAELHSHLARHYRRNHGDAFAIGSRVSDDAFYWRAEGLNSIGHNLWHLARWADHLQSILSVMTPSLAERIGPRPEIWTAENLLEAWGWQGFGLGHVETGIGMDETTTSHLTLPARETVLEYARRTFELAGERAESLTDEELGQPAEVAAERAPWLPPTPEARAVVGSWAISYLRHDAQHLGAMLTLESLLKTTAPV